MKKRKKKSKGGVFANLFKAAIEGVSDAGQDASDKRKEQKKDCGACPD